jgi:hypothetical protein
MYCPACSQKNEIEQKFCRACGMNLEQSVASLLSQFGDDARNVLLHSEKKLERFGSIAFTGFGVVIGLAILAFVYLIATRMIISGTQPLAGVLAIAFIIFAGLTLGYVFWAEWLKEKKKKLTTTRASQDRSAIEPAETSRLLSDQHFEPVPSVVEDTTELLRVPRSAQNPERE